MNARDAKPGASAWMRTRTVSDVELRKSHASSLQIPGKVQKTFIKQGVRRWGKGEYLAMEDLLISRADERSSQLQGLRNDVDCLRQQIATLTKCVTTLVDRQPQEATYLQGQSPLSPFTNTGSRCVAVQRTGTPEQPQFVGPTRSEFSFNIAETTIARMDAGPHGLQPQLPASPSTSRDHTPEHEVEQLNPLDHSAADGLSEFTCAEVIRLLEVYHEEIACVHPIIDAKDLIQYATKAFEPFTEPIACSSKVQSRDIQNVHMVKIAIATALIHETHGKNAVSDNLIASVEKDVNVISFAHTVELKDIQIMGMLVRKNELVWAARLMQNRVCTSATPQKNCTHGVRLVVQRGRPSKWVSIADRAS